MIHFTILPVWRSVISQSKGFMLSRAPHRRVPKVMRILKEIAIAILVRDNRLSGQDRCHMVGSVHVLGSVHDDRYPVAYRQRYTCCSMNFRMSSSCLSLCILL